MWWSTGLTTAVLLLTSHVSASFIDTTALASRPRTARRTPAAAPLSIIDRRAMNVTAWDAETESACTVALAQLKGVASNPSGMAFCYNLAFLDKATGIFQADLRLFTVAGPSGDFAGLSSSAISLGLQFVGATASTIDANQLTPRDTSSSGSSANSVSYSLMSWPLSRAAAAEEGLGKRQNALPVQGMKFAFVGQINKNLVSANLNNTALQAVVIPIVTLNAKVAAGSAIATLSASDATFVMGVFSDSPKTATTAAQVVSSVVYIVPGRSFGIFPFGLIVTAVWAFLGIGTVGYGTYGRYQFRMQYRSRVARGVARCG